MTGKLLISFVTGVVVGALTGGYLFKKHYDERLEEEVASVKEAFNYAKKMDGDSPKEKETPKIKKEDGNIMQYAEKITEAGYRNYSDVKDDTANLQPFVISPSEFGDCDYDEISLVYYQGDDVLCDDKNNIVTNVERKVGAYSLTRFGEYVDDIIHVRNHLLKADYEIMLDSRSYSDVEDE